MITGVEMNNLLYILELFSNGISNGCKINVYVFKEYAIDIAKFIDKYSSNNISVIVKF